MEQIKADGPAAVADLLRHIAEGVECGTITLGQATIPISPQVSAAVQVPDDNSGEVTIVHIGLAAGRERRRRLGVEKELIHPGG